MEIYFPWQWLDFTKNSAPLTVENNIEKGYGS